MLESALATLKDLAVHNQILSGGFVLMAGGFLMNWARKLPQFIQGRFLLWCTTSIVVESRDELFWWLQVWLAAQPAIGRSGNLSASSRNGDGPTLHVSDSCSSGPIRPRVLFSPAPGRHWMRYEGCWIAVDRSKNDTAKVEQKAASWSAETLHIRLYTRNRAVGRRLFEEARDFAMPPEDRRATIHGARYDSWYTLMRTNLRGPETVILERGVMNGLLADVREFLDTEDWYVARGLPYRRGYLLHGPPGNGKSSAIMAVASHFRYGIATLNLGSEILNDENLRNIFANVPPRTVLVIEDVDRDLTPAAQDGQVETRRNKLTFSAILNLLDGIGSPEGRILFMTTNHRERLDPAMIRPGRVDREYAIGNASADQAERLFIRFFPDRDDLALDFAGYVGDRGLSMATLQGHLLLHKDDPKTAAGTAYRLAEDDQDSDVLKASA